MKSERNSMDSSRVNSAAIASKQPAARGQAEKLVNLVEYKKCAIYAYIDLIY